MIRDALTHAISIDYLLDAHRDNEAAAFIGKLGIVSCILGAEKQSDIFTSPNEGKKININTDKEIWFQYFFNMLTERINRSEVDQVFQNIEIINFNYDRCIEHYLNESFQNYYSFDQVESATLLNHMRIYRPYGSVGKLPWQNSNTSVPYGSENSNLLALASQIKTFNEQIETANVIDQIRSAIQQAEVIVFLGFAFHRQNMELLFSGNNYVAKKIFATADGISKSDSELIYNDLYNEFFKKAKIEFRNDLKCGGLFKEYWRSLTS